MGKLRGRTMKQTKTATIVTENVELELVDPEGTATSLDADLVFDPADPYAATIVFRNGMQEVGWTFARELLIDGLYEPTGDGDVHVWPCLASDASSVVIIELSSPDGELLVQAPARRVNAFVARMLASVPEGHEAFYVDLDTELALLLG